MFLYSRNALKVAFLDGGSWFFFTSHKSASLGKKPKINKDYSIYRFLFPAIERGSLISNLLLERMWGLKQTLKNRPTGISVIDDNGNYLTVLDVEQKLWKEFLSSFILPKKTLKKRNWKAGFLSDQFYLKQNMLNTFNSQPPYKYISDVYTYYHITWKWHAVDTLLLKSQVLFFLSTTMHATPIERKFLWQME